MTIIINIITGINSIRQSIRVLPRHKLKPGFFTPVPWHILELEDTYVANSL